MSETLIKPRWEAWQNNCLQAGFIQKIQHKILALALGKTVTAISKKIKQLGLRDSSSVRGRIKGQKEILSPIEKSTEDLEKMVEILKAFAPLGYFQERQIVLKGGCWSQSQRDLTKNHKTESCFDSLELYNPSFSFVKPLDFIDSKEGISKRTRVKKIPGDSVYVCLGYVEKWAEKEGFQKTKGALHRRGLPYWKDGTYFSQTQLLMHVNRLRFEHSLQPLALIDEERGFLT